MGNNTVCKDVFLVSKLPEYPVFKGEALDIGLN